MPLEGIPESSFLCKGAWGSPQGQIRNQVHVVLRNSKFENLRVHGHMYTYVHIQMHVYQYITSGATTAAYKMRGVE